MSDTALVDLAPPDVPVGTAAWVARERGPGYAAGPPDGGAGPYGKASPDGSASLLSSDPEVVGAALTGLPTERLAQVVGAAVAALAGDEAVRVVGAGAARLDDARALEVCRLLLGSWDSAELLSGAEDAIGALGRRTLSVGAVSDAALLDSWARLHRLERRVTAEKYRRLREINERGSHLTEGARTPVDLLVRHGLTRGEAREQVETAAALGELPKAEKALADGTIGAGQAAEAGKALAEVRQTAADGDLADAAAREAQRAEIDDTVGEASPETDRRRLREQLEAQAAARSKDRLAAKERRAHHRRYGRKFLDGDGLTLQFHGPGAAVQKIWKMIEALSRRTTADDERTPEQRRFDAVGRVADRYLREGRLPDVAGQSAQVLLITTHDAAHDVPGAAPPTVDGWGPVSSETARMICCDAEITVVVMGDDGQPLRLGRTRYQPTRAQRRAVIARDRVCIGCGEDAAHCEIHHVIWWDNDGPTDIENLVLGCPNCHTHIHHHGWVVWRDAGGRYHTGPHGPPPDGPRRGGSAPGAPGPGARAEDHPHDRQRP